MSDVKSPARAEAVRKNSGFNLYLPPDASLARREAHERLRVAVEAEAASPTEAATAIRREAETALGRVLLEEDKARRPDFYAPSSPPAEALPSQTSGAEGGGEDEEDERRRDAWSDFEAEHLTDGEGHATAEAYAACRQAFDKAWPLGWEKANAAAFAAFNVLAKPASEPAGGGGLREAAQALFDSRASTYKARNGRRMSIEDDSGEMMWLVPFDEMHALEAALSSPASSSPAEWVKFGPSEDGIKAKANRQVALAEAEALPSQTSGAEGDLIKFAKVGLHSLEMEWIKILNNRPGLSDRDFARLKKEPVVAQLLADIEAARRAIEASAPAQEDGSKELSAHPRGSGQSLRGHGHE